MRVSFASKIFLVFLKLYKKATKKIIFVRNIFVLFKNKIYHVCTKSYYLKLRQFIGLIQTLLFFIDFDNIQIVWTPDGRRLVTGAASGEFTLWNGMAFNFETILQAHDQPVRAMSWSNDGHWLATGDHGGYIKYWQQNMNNCCMFQAHKDQPSQLFPSFGWVRGRMDRRTD